jgi:hypothetical protein
MAEINALAPPTLASAMNLDRGERLHWPVKDAEHGGTPILHVGKFARGLGKFAATVHVPRWK